MNSFQFIQAEAYQAQRKIFYLRFYSVALIISWAWSSFR